MEKKNKRKFWGTLTSFVLTFMFISSWAVLGIALALKNADVNVGGSVSFSNSNIYATIEKVGLTGNAGNVDGKMGTITYNGSTDTAPAAEETWEGIALAFADPDSGKPADIVLTFKITNTNAENKNLRVKVADITATKKENVTATVALSDEKTVGEEFTLAKDASVTVTITFSVDDADQDAFITGWLVRVDLLGSVAAA